MKKKLSQKALTAKCDRLFSLYVRQRDGFCQSGRSLSAGCDGQYNLQCAHGFSRRYFATRWEDWNAFALCRSCHVYFTHRPLEWEAWLQERWGPESYLAHRMVALAGEKPDKVYVAERFKALLDEAA